MSSLYELTAEYMMLLEMAEDPDVDPQAFADTLEGLGGEIEIKADGYAKVIKQLEYDKAACDGEIKRLQGKKKTIENSIERLKRSLKESMECTGKLKFKTGLFSFSVANNPASVVVDVDWLAVPKKYLKPAEPTVDKALLKQDLKDGVNLEGIAHLSQTTGLRIK